MTKVVNHENKQMSVSSPVFVKGGNGSMNTRGGVGNQEPGVTATTRGGKNSFGVKGGSGRMSGKNSSGNLKAE